MVDAISDWVRADIANEAARCVSQQLDGPTRQARFATLTQTAQVEQRAAVRLIAMATLRMESRRAALRWLAGHLGGDYVVADEAAQACVATSRRDTNAMSSRQRWARQALTRMAGLVREEDRIGDKSLANPADVHDLVALDANIDEVIAGQEAARQARWAQLGPSAVAARETLAIEQLAVGGVLLAGHRADILADLLAVADGFHGAAGTLIAQLDPDLKIALRQECENQAAGDLRALSGQLRYRQQLVAWASSVAMDLDEPQPIELRSVAPRAGGQGARTPASRR